MLFFILTFTSFMIYLNFTKYLLQTNTVETTEQKEYVLVLSYIFLMFLSLLPISSMINLMREYNLM
jgi:uncharacterized membrane protein